ncbi:MAG: hypothetical protein K9N51_10025 [Candidatus Pacebacteria bacterium]|nr:hypothetical protein [Candidatus Paceibacterota bacterium]
MADRGVVFTHHWHKRVAARLRVSAAAALFLYPAAALSAANVHWGVNQEIGYEEDITSGTRQRSDTYSETGLSLSLQHPPRLWDGKLEVNPTLRLSYRDYINLNELDAVIVQFSGPLTLDLKSPANPSRNLILTLNASREINEVGTITDEQTPITDLALAVLYTQNIRSSRWKVEAGYDYNRIMYDDSAYSELEQDTHGISLAMLYAVTRNVQVGARGRLTLETFPENDDDNTQTAEATLLARWRLTGRMDAEIEAGYESVTYEHGGDREGGATLRGAVHWQPNERWQYRGQLRHEREVFTEDTTEQMTTTEVDFSVSYDVTSKLTVGLAPSVSSENGDTRATEYSVDTTVAYAFSMCDVVWRAGVTQHRSDAGGRDDYTALNSLIRLSMDF